MNSFWDTMVTGAVAIVIVILAGWGGWLLLSGFLRSWGL